MRQDLVNLIIDLAREVLEADGEGVDRIEEDSRLFGREGMLDSMGLVSLIVAVEQGIEDRFGQSIALADEKALSQSSSPYRTVGTLADYAVGLLAGSTG